MRAPTLLHHWLGSLRSCTDLNRRTALYRRDARARSQPGFGGYHGGAAPGRPNRQGIVCMFEDTRKVEWIRKPGPKDP